MFQKKIVFWEAKKQWQTDKLFCDFRLCVGLCELQMCLAVWAKKNKVRDSTPDFENENVFKSLCVLVPQLENVGFGFALYL